MSIVCDDFFYEYEVRLRQTEMACSGQNGNGESAWSFVIIIM